MGKWIDITADVLTEKGLVLLKAGDMPTFTELTGFALGYLLVFDFEGSKTKLKITRLDTKRGRVWAKDVTEATFTEEELKEYNSKLLRAAQRRARTRSKTRRFGR